MSVLNNARKRVSELIGRWTTYDVTISQTSRTVRTYDDTRTDYVFWDAFRRGKKKGYYISSLFAPRIESIIASWVFGTGFDVVTGDNYTDKLIRGFLAELSDTRNMDSVLPTVFKNGMGLGDQFVIVNSNGTVTIPSPESVTVNRDEMNPSIVLSISVKTKTAKYEITDTYYPDRRTRLVTQGNKTVSDETFENFIGEIPVVHIKYGAGVNENFGHSIHEQLLPVYDLYDDTLNKQASGARVSGNPILTITGLKNMKQVKDANKPSTPETYIDKNGVTQTRNTLTLDKDSILLIGEGGDAKMVAPAVGFTKDTQATMDALFLILIYHIGIPAFIFGGDMASSRSNNETQMTQWVHDIEGYQTHVSVWVKKLCYLWLKLQAVSGKRVKTTDIKVVWKPLIPVDESVLLKKVQLAIDKGLITPETALQLIQLVDDAKKESKEAEQYAITKATDALNQAGLNQTDPGVIKPGSGNNTTTAKAEMPTLNENKLIDAIKQLRKDLNLKGVDNG